MAHFAHFIEFLYNFLTPHNPPQSSSFLIFPIFPFTFHAYCVSKVYAETVPVSPFTLLSLPIRFFIREEAKDVADTNLFIRPHILENVFIQTRKQTDGLLNP